MPCSSPRSRRSPRCPAWPPTAPPRPVWSSSATCCGSRWRTSASGWARHIPIWIDTDLVRGLHGTTCPATAARAGKMPWPLSTEVSAEQCAQALVRGMEKRKRRVYMPAFDRARSGPAHGHAQQFRRRHRQARLGRWRNDHRDGAGGPRARPFLREQQCWLTASGAAAGRRWCSSTASGTAGRRGSRCSTSWPAHHEVIAIDLPGFGRSPVPREGMPHGMAETVAWIGELFVAEGLARPHVAGNSLGGAIALELAAGGLVSSATALSPAGFYTEAERRRALRILNTMRLNTFLPAPVMRVGLRFAAIRAASFAGIVVAPGSACPPNAPTKTRSRCGGARVSGRWRSPLWTIASPARPRFR